MAKKQSKKLKAINQAGVVPYRKKGKDIEFCLITSSRSQRWGFPKGVIERGESAEEAALKEAYEEAGLQGKIVGAPLGFYRYTKFNTRHEVVFLLMRVKRSAKEWDEADFRDRVWVKKSKARKLLCRAGYRKLLEKALKTFDN